MKINFGIKGQIEPDDFYGFDGLLYHTDDECDNPTNVSVHLSGKVDTDVDFYIHVNEYGKALIQLGEMTNMSMVERSFAQAHSICSTLGLDVVDSKDEFYSDMYTSEVEVCSARVDIGHDGMTRFIPENQYHLGGFCSFLNDHTDLICLVEQQCIMIPYELSVYKRELMAEGILGMYKKFCSSGLSENITWDEIALNKIKGKS